MLSSDYYTSGIKGDVASIDFENYIPTDSNPSPDFRVYNFIVNGPYVLKTDGALETEYLYERDKVLNEDYLAAEGGEHALIPYIGLTHKNNYLGDKTLAWVQGRRKWGCLRFDSEDYNACNDALYLTEQRNCAYYAAVYVDCKKDYDAVICYETSGSLLYLNGELIDNKPYGRTKGLWDFANMVYAHFHKGRNLLLLKVRTGYICDTIDIAVSNFTLYPILASSGALGVCYPTFTRAYFGSKEEPRQVLPTFLCAMERTDGGKITIKSGKYRDEINIDGMSKGEVKIIRPSLPALKSGIREFSVTAEEAGHKADSYTGKLSVTEYDGFEGTEHIYSDFHFDTTYHQEQRTYALGAIDILAKMLRKLRNNPDFKCTLAEVDYLHPYYSIYVGDRKTLKEAFMSGRAEADCFYNQPNEMTSSPEGFVRNLIYGQLYHRDVLGRKAYVYGLGDVFGHPNQLSQICKKGACEGIYWGKHIFGLDCLFNHMSPDGTALVHSRGGTPREYANELGVHHSYDSSGLGEFVPYPRDDDTSWMAKTVNGAEFGVMSDFFTGINEDNSKQTENTGHSPLETTSRDISLYHAGVSLTRQDLKRANRLGENLLITAEKLAAIAAYYGATYPDEALDKAWRQILCGQHHDSITGTNNEISFVDLMIEYREAASLASDIIDNALDFISSGISASGENPIIVFNPHAYDRHDVCELILPLSTDKSYIMRDSEGKEYNVQLIGSADSENNIKAVFTPDVPALGYKVYYLSEKKEKSVFLQSEQCFIENEYYRVKVSPEKGGSIVSIYDKKEKKEIINASDGKCAAVYALKEMHDRMETQHEFYTSGEKLSSAESTASVRREKGAVCDRLIIESDMDIICHLKQEITLTKGVKRIDVIISIENYTGNDHLFTYNLPVDISGAKAVFDDRFSPAVRPKSRNVLDFKTHQYAMASHCSVFAANQWFALGSTVTVMLGEAGSFNIGPTAIISTDSELLKSSAELLTAALTKKAVPVTPYPDRERKTRATLLPHFNDDLHFTDTRFVLSISGTENIYENKLLSDSRVKARFESAVEKKGSAVLYTRDSDNLWSKPIDVILLKGKDEKALLNAVAAVSDELSKSSVLTLRDCILASKPDKAEDYTVSILNRGNLASSIEGDDSLNIMLFHTAEFYGNNGKVTGARELVPEQKSHIYEFAVMPHSGSYREGKEYIRAMEYNDGLLIKRINAKADSSRILPEKQSFVKCSENFLLTSFKAGGYPLASLKGKMPDIKERGFTLRGFENKGTASEVSIKFAFCITDSLSTDLLEENPQEIKHGKNSLHNTVGAHSIETYNIFASPAEAEIGEARIGSVCEPVKPTYIRSWEHSRGSMPFSYLRTAAVIDRKAENIDDTHFTVNVSVANNRTDAPIKGKMKLKVPKNMTASRNSFDYKLGSGEYQLYPVTIKKENKDAKGIIYLYFEDGENEFYDALEVGFFSPSVTMKTDGSDIIVTVRNDTAEDLFGELSIATPTESWGMRDKRSDALCDISPLSKPVSLKANTRAEYVFKVREYGDEVFNAYWACAKLMVNGRVYYSYARRTGIRRNLFAHEFISELTDSGNSQYKYLTLKNGMPAE